MNSALQDLRYAARTLLRSPGFAAIAVLTLGLGIGANTALFSVVHGVLLRPLPYADPDRLVRIWEANPTEGIEQGAVSPGTLVDLRQRARTMERVALFGGRDRLISFGDVVEEVWLATVSPALFDVLGTRPILGRGLSAEDTREPSSTQFDEVVIGFGVWQRHFAGDQEVIGRTIREEGLWPLTIVGVMPADFDFPDGAQIWTQLAFGDAVSPAQRQLRYYDALGQLRAGSSLEDARAETAAIARQLEVEHPASNAGWTMQLERLDESMVGATRPMLLVLLGLVGCVLVIACGNVASLMLARATARRHEVAVRMALGASGLRLVRQWLSEGALLAALGGTAGLAIAYWTSHVLIAVAPADIPRLDEIGFSAPVLVFALIATAAATIVTGLAPALQATGPRAMDALRSGRAPTESGRVGGREWLVGAQVALTLVLLVAATLLLRSMVVLRGVDLGFVRENVLAAELRVPVGRFVGDGQAQWLRRIDWYDELITDLSGLPGVRSVGGITDVPLTRELPVGNLWRTDAAGAQSTRPPTSAVDQWQADIRVVTPEYFETMGIPVVRGRGFRASDRFTGGDLTDARGPRPPGVAIINQAMASRFWPREDPLGQTIYLQDDEAFAAFRTVVGVAGDVRAHAVAEPAAPTVYLPYAQHPGRGLALVVRTDFPPAQLQRAVAERLRAFDPQVSVSGVRPLETIVARSLSRPRFSLLLAGGFAVLALLLAGIGIFGVVAYLVTRRTREIGIRIALGARRVDVLCVVLKEGLRPVLLGMLTGVPGALVVAQAMRALLYGLEPVDPTSFLAAAAVLLLVAAMAALLPAHRAAGVDPVEALRRY